MTIRVAIIGYGKIAHDQHAPAIADNPAFELAAVAGGSGTPPADGIERFADTAELLANQRESIDAVAICTPPGPRYAIARDCLNAGLDVLLEKPPCATVGEVDALAALARANGRTLFAAWHSQFSPAVAPAADALAGKVVRSLSIDWHEDVRRWHPGQDWVLAAGGFGVFDPGINALSIATRILPGPLLVRSATLTVPANRQSPIAAELGFGDALEASFDWRVRAEERRTIRVEASDGTVVEIGEGGGTLVVGGTPHPLPARAEYPAMYVRFAELIAQRQSDVDREPLRIVADAQLVGERQVGDAFEWAAT